VHDDLRGRRAPESEDEQRSKHARSA
jgi:hypothetical protein